MSGPEDSAHPGAGDPKQLSLGVANFIETEPSPAATKPVAVTRSREAAAAVGEGSAPMSPTRRRLVSEEMEPQMVLVRLLEDARWVQKHTRATFKGTKGVGPRLSLLKFFWSVRTELVKALQGLGVLPRELFFADEENDFDHLPTEVAETISGLLSRRIEPDQAQD